MDIQSQTTEPISDDQELAKVLAGVNQQANAAAELEATALDSSTAEIKPADQTVPVPDTLPTVDVQSPESVVSPMMPGFEMTPAPGGESLEAVKKEAIDELKPLVEKLNLPADEKFDLYLLLIRSTDDKSLIGPAHDTAKEITDETRRAQALLDIIKEIDYLTDDKKTEIAA